MNDAKQGSVLLGVGILTLFIPQMGAVNYIQTILGRLMEYYSGQVSPEIIAYLISIASLGTIVGGLIVGAILSRRLMGYKTLAIIGTLAVFLGGCLPTFIHDFWFLMISRAVLGLGAGFMTPLANPLIKAFFSGDRYTRLVSFGVMIGQIGSLAAQFLAGVLCDIGLWLTFLAEGISILSLVSAFFIIKEPSADALQEEKKKERGALPANVLYAAACILIAAMGIMPLLFNFSVYAGKLTSSATVIATIQMTFTAGMIIGSALFQYTYRLFKRFTLTMACVFGAAGILVFMTVGNDNLPLMYVGKFIAALGYSQMLPSVLQICGISVAPRLIGFASSIVFGAMTLGVFLVAPYLQLVGAITGDGLAIPIWIGAGLFVVLAVLTAVASPFPKTVAQIQSATAKGEGE
jgi:MFS family permease